MFRSNLLRTALNVTKATHRMVSVQMASAPPLEKLVSSAPASAAGAPFKLNLVPVKEAPPPPLFEYRTWNGGDVDEVVSFIVDNFIRREVLMQGHRANDENARQYIQYNVEVRTAFDLMRRFFRFFSVFVVVYLS